MYRSPDDIALLTELAGVLDTTVDQNGLSAGTYLVLRQLVAAGKPMGVSALAMVLEAEPEEVAEMTRRLSQRGWVTVRGQGVQATERADELLQRIDADATDAMREYVLDRPHSPTVYGLVASMQSGRFTVDDLLEFIAQGPTEDDED